MVVVVGREVVEVEVGVEVVLVGSGPDASGSAFLKEAAEHCFDEASVGLE